MLQASGLSKPLQKLIFSPSDSPPQTNRYSRFRPQVSIFNFLSHCFSVINSIHPLFGVAKLIITVFYTVAITYKYYLIFLLTFYLLYHIFAVVINQMQPFIYLHSVIYRKTEEKTCFNQRFQRKNF